MDAAGFPNHAPINVWVISGPYFLLGIAEIFASITTLEFAFTKVSAAPIDPKIHPFLPSSVVNGRILLTSCCLPYLLFPKAPKQMKGFVTAFAQFQSSLGIALGFALTPVTTEDKFIWVYGACAVTSWVVGTLFFVTFRKLDAQEAELNAVGTGEREGFDEKHGKGNNSVS